MANPYYNHTTYPQTGSPGSSASLRAELESIEAGFDGVNTGKAGAGVNADITSLTNLTGNINFVGLGNRITGDFSNATQSSRVLFQTSALNSSTIVGAIPSGSSTQSQIQAYSSSDANNAVIGQLLVTSTEVSFRSVAVGSGVLRPMTFYTNSAERMRIDTNGTVAIGTTPAVGTNLMLGRNDVGQEGGQLGFCRSTDNSQAWFIDVNGSTATPTFRIVDSLAVLSRFEIDSSGNVISKSSTGALGYGAGAGGSVTQITSKSTSVTLNKPNGRIVMSNEAMVAGAVISFTVNNNLVGAQDHIILSQKFGVTNYRAQIIDVTNGTFVIQVENRGGGTVSEAINLGFALIKGVTA